MRILFSLLALFLVTTQIHATDMYMARSASSFPETMSKLQEIIKAEGYKVSRVQRVDIGLTAMGYKTDKYRVVFYGKAEENKKLVKQYPFLIPYLPLKMSTYVLKDTIISIQTINYSISKLHLPS